MRTIYLANHDAHLAYHDYPGAEPACVYLHGLGSASSVDFPRVAADPALVAHRSILIDLLGFGFSDRPDDFDHSLVAHADVVAQLIDALELKQCRIVGHSWGGSIATVLAARRPDLVWHLIVAEPNFSPADATLSGTIAAQVEAYFVSTGHRALIAEAKGWAAEYPPLGYFPTTLRAADPLAMHRASVHLVAAELAETFVELPMARSYLIGAETLPHPHEALMRENEIPLVVIPNVGHIMMAGNPDGFIEALTAEIQRFRRR